VQPVIIAENASKTFTQRLRSTGFGAAVRDFIWPKTRPVHAVEDISFGIGAGEAVGYLGPNGAGKSTMIKMLTGILVPSSGRVEVLGRNPSANRIANARDIGVVFGQRSQLWWDLPVRDSFDLHGRIYRVEQGRFQARQTMLVEMLEIGDYLDRPVRQLSLGQRMRAEMAMALLHEPKLLFLDEPTIGLDVMAKDVVRRFLSEVNRQDGVTIILTTHDLQDIEQICPRLIMVDEGKLLFDGRTDKLHSSFGARRRLTLHFEQDPGELGLLGVELVEARGKTREYLVDDPDRSLVEIIGEIGSRGQLRDVRLEEPDIEEVIRTYFRARRVSLG
jgi:ABC-2 type transport system ATP-binding protein